MKKLFLTLPIISLSSCLGYVAGHPPFRMNELAESYGISIASFNQTGDARHLCWAAETAASRNETVVAIGSEAERRDLTMKHLRDGLRIAETQSARTQEICAIQTIDILEHKLTGSKGGTVSKSPALVSCLGGEDIAPNQITLAQFESCIVETGYEP